MKFRNVFFFSHCQQYLISFHLIMQLDSTENEETSDGVLVRLQSQQMLDQIHGDEPLQSSGTGPVDGDNDSSAASEPDSAEDPRQLEETEWVNKLGEKIRLMGRVETNTRSNKKLGDDGFQKTDTVQNNGNKHVYYRKHLNF